MANSSCFYTDGPYPESQILIGFTQSGHDHSYHFIASFIGEHLAFHAKALAGR